MKFVAAATVLLAAGVALWFALGESPRAAPAAPAVTTSTATVMRGDVVQRVQVAGTLGFAGAYSVVSQLPAGVLTAVAPDGRTIRRGERLFAVSAVPVTLLYGRMPAYREFASGMSDGEDVHALERNLAALGLDPGPVDDHFDWATRAAIVRWQEAQGVPAGRRTGRLAMGSVAFLPGPLRVKQASAPGAAVAPGARVLTATSTRRVVTARVSTDQASLVRRDDRVRVALPSRGVPGRVTRVGRVATPSDSGGATIAVTIALRARGLDGAPVQVAITSERRRDVLMVPVTALRARSGGGYDVRSEGRDIPVRPGLYDDAAGTVEVTGVREGATVEVPAQ